MCVRVCESMMTSHINLQSVFHPPHPKISILSYSSCLYSSLSCSFFFFVLLTLSHTCSLSRSLVFQSHSSSFFLESCFLLFFFIHWSLSLSLTIFSSVPLSFFLSYATFAFLFSHILPLYIVYLCRSCTLSSGVFISLFHFLSSFLSSCISSSCRSTCFAVLSLLCSALLSLTFSLTLLYLSSPVYLSLSLSLPPCLSDDWLCCISGLLIGGYGGNRAASSSTGLPGDHSSSSSDHEDEDEEDEEAGRLSLFFLLPPMSSLRLSV